MAAVAYSEGCKSSDFSGQLSQLRKSAVCFHFFIVFFFKKGKMMQINCGTRQSEYVLELMLQNGSKECLKITSLLP